MPWESCVVHPSSSIVGESLSRALALAPSSLWRVLSSLARSSVDVGSLGWLLKSSTRAVVAALETSMLPTLVVSSTTLRANRPQCVVLVDVARVSTSS